MNRPDYLNKSKQERAALASGDWLPKEEPVASPQLGEEPLVCECCGQSLILRRAFVDDNALGHSVFWCLNALCDSFCDDVCVP